jgi:hypothetical protein
LKNDFMAVGASTLMSQSGFSTPVAEKKGKAAEQALGFIVFF